MLTSTFNFVFSFFTFPSSLLLHLISFHCAFPFFVESSSVSFLNVLLKNWPAGRKKWRHADGEGRGTSVQREMGFYFFAERIFWQETAVVGYRDNTLYKSTRTCGGDASATCRQSAPHVAAFSLLIYLFQSFTDVADAIPERDAAKGSSSSSSWRCHGHLMGGTLLNQCNVWAPMKNKRMKVKLISESLSATVGS